MDKSLEDYIKNYPFLQYIKEDKSRYKHAKDCGYSDPDDLFLIGESGGFLLNIHPDDRFVDTEQFIEVSLFYKQNGNKYTNFKEDSIPHRQFRKREEYRRRNGFTAPALMRNGKIQDIRITGDMYNYLNYTMMESLDESTAKSDGVIATGKKSYNFPKFIDAQFWTFHIVEFAERNGLNLIIDKTRRGGFSYIMASHSANCINLRPRKVEIHVAADKKYLTKVGGLTDFTINDLRFYETKTPFKRGILGMDPENFRLGYKLPNGMVAQGSWNSALFSVSAANNPDCAIGKDAINVKVEELSTMENFDSFLSVTEPAMRTGAYVTGNLFCWGTATSGNMQTFEQNFYNPKAGRFMAFENVWDKDLRHEVCGYFKPYAWGLQGQFEEEYAMDKDGNSNLEVGLRISFNERKEKKSSAKTFADYINYLGQYANMPSESFSSTTENLFSSEELMAWEEKLRTDTSYNFYVDGMLFKDPDDSRKVVFKSNARLEAEGGKHNVDFYDYIVNVPKKQHEHHHGCIRKWFNPIKVNYKNAEGKECFGTPPGIYSISYDPVGINKDHKELTNKHSHNSIKVWMEPSVYNNFKTACVASYYGRPDKLEEADFICYMLAVYYNCVGTTGVEINRGETVSNFTKWKALRYLMKDPVQIWDTSLKSSVAGNYGVNIGDGVRKLEGLRLLKEMLYSVVGKNDLGEDVKFYQTIYDYQSILELKKWNAVGNFDRVSEMIIRALRWKLLDVDASKELAQRKKIKEDNDNIWARDWF